MMLNLLLGVTTQTEIQTSVAWAKLNTNLEEEGGRRAEINNFKKIR